MNTKIENEDSILKWETLSEEKKADCHIFEYWVTKMTNQEGKTGNFTVLKAPSWVTVIARKKTNPNEEPKLILVKQYRQGSGAITLEHPAGMVEPGEPPLAAAKRELREETGCESNDWVELGSVNPNPAFMNNRAYTFFADNCIEKHKLELDQNEVLKPLEMNQSEVFEKMGTGQFDNGVMVMATYLFKRHLEKQEGTQK